MLIPEKEMNHAAVEGIVKEHLYYIHFNTMISISTLEDKPVYVITNDQRNCRLITNDKDIETIDDDDEDSVLSKVQRYHLFTRIRDRSGLPSKTMLDRIKGRHQS